MLTVERFVDSQQIHVDRMKTGSADSLPGVAAGPRLTHVITIMQIKHSGGRLNKSGAT